MCIHQFLQYFKQESDHLLDYICIKNYICCIVYQSFHELGMAEEMPRSIMFVLQIFII